MSEKSSRLHYIDVARALSMILLIIGHALGHSENSKYVYKMIYSFVVPLFFLVSGFLMNKKGSFTQFARSKFVRIMIPYFIWAVLFLVPYCLFGASVADNLDITQKNNAFVFIRNILYGIGKDHSLQQNSSLWFLPALFSMSLFYYPVIHTLDRIHRDWVWWATFAALCLIGYAADHYLTIALPWGINTVLVAGVYFFAGYLMKRYDIITRLLDSRLKPIWLLCLGIAGFISGSSNRALGFMDYEIGNVWYAYISGISFSVLILCLSHWIGKNKLLEWIGKNTLPIMIFHKLPILLFQTRAGLVTSLLMSSNLAIEGLMAILVSIIAIAFSLIAGFVLRNIFPLAIGEKASKAIT